MRCWRTAFPSSPTPPATAPRPCAWTKWSCSQPGATAPDCRQRPGRRTPCLHAGRRRAAGRGRSAPAQPAPGAGPGTRRARRTGQRPACRHWCTAGRLRRGPRQTSATDAGDARRRSPGLAARAFAAGGSRAEPRAIPSIAPTGRAAGEAALQIELGLARAALERDDTAAFRASIARIETWLTRLWPDSPALRLQRAELKALAQRVAAAGTADPRQHSGTTAVAAQRRRLPSATGHHGRPTIDRAPAPVKVER